MNVKATAHMCLHSAKTKPVLHKTEGVLHTFYFVLVTMEGNVALSIVAGMLCVFTVTTLFVEEF